MFLLLSFVFCFVLQEVQLEIFHFLHILLDMLVGITLLHLNKKIQKINRHLVDKVKPLMFYHETQNFSYNPNDNLKNRCHSKTFLAMQFLNYCLNQLFLETFLAPKQFH